MRRFSPALVIAIAALAISAAAAPAAPPSRDARLPMVSFNVLAPVWAAPDWYPPEMDMSLLDADYRRARITAFLAARAADTDIFCLQEVQESELPAFLAALGSGFTGAMAHNDRDWWSNWVVPAIPWAPNGTAIVVRRRAFSNLTFRDIPLSGDGNHAELVEGVHRATGRRLRAASIHLDSDVEANRGREARALMAELPAGGRHHRRGLRRLQRGRGHGHGGRGHEARGLRRRAGRRRQSRADPSVVELVQRRNALGDHRPPDGSRSPAPER